MPTPTATRVVVPSAFTGQAIVTACVDCYFNGGHVSLGDGIYRITETMHLDASDFSHQALNAMKIYGNGPRRTDGYYNTVDGSGLLIGGTALEWNGPSGQPMMILHAHGTEIEGVTFNGMGSGLIGLVYGNHIGFGSSHLHLKRVQFQGFLDSCLQLGDPSGANADFGKFDQCDFGSASVGVKQVSAQAVIQDFYSCGFGDLDIGIDSRIGGAINIFGGGSNYVNLMLRVGTEGGAVNSGNIAIYGFKAEMEGRSQKWGRLLECTQNYNQVFGLQVVLNNVRCGNQSLGSVPDSDATAITVYGRHAVYITDSQLVQNGSHKLIKAYGEKDAEAVIHIDRCMIAFDQLTSLNQAISATDHTRISMDHLTDEFGRKISKYSHGQV